MWNKERKRDHFGRLFYALPFPSSSFRQRKPREPKAPKPKKQKQEVLSAKQKKKIVSKQFISSSEDNSSSDEEGLKIDVAKT